MLPMMRIRAVYVAMHRVDFRKSYDGLLGECYQMGVDPFAGDMVLFVGRHKRCIKILFADSTGVWLACKRFSEQSMRTRFRFLIDPSVQTISAGELQLFCEGARYTLEQRVKPQLSALV